METFSTERKYVVQSYELINSKMNLNAVELNLLYVFISQIKVRDKEFKKYSVHRKDLEEMLGTKLNYKYLDTATTSLMLPFKIECRGTNNYSKRTLFSGIDFIDNVFTFQFNESMKEHLIGLRENFVSAKFLGRVSKMKSAYSKRIYFMLRQRLLLKEWTISVDSLRDKIVDPDSKSMKLFNNFKRKVLDKAMEEINSVESDIKVDYEVIKEGKAVKEIRFLIKANKKAIKEEMDKNLELNNQIIQNREQKKIDQMPKVKARGETTSGVSAVDAWLKEQEETDSGLIIDTEAV